MSGFEQAHMKLYAMAARRRQGESLGGKPGERLVAEADEWMAKQGIRDAEKMTRMLAPGF